MQHVHHYTESNEYAESKEWFKKHGNQRYSKEVLKDLEEWKKRWLGK